MIVRLILIFQIIFLAFIQKTSAAEMGNKAVGKNFEVIKEPSCIKAKVKEPPPPRNSAWYERNYISVDGSSVCQIHQFSIFWMSDSVSDNRKYSESTLYRLEKGNWIAEYGLGYIPKIRIRDKLSGRVYLVVDKDFGDFQVKQIAFYTGSWRKVWAHPGKFGIHTLWGECMRLPDCRDEKVGVETAVELLASRSK